METMPMDEERKSTGQDELKQHIEEMLRQENRKTPETLRETAWLLESLAALMEQSGSGDIDGEKVSAYGIYAVKYIQTHFKEKIRIRDLAEHIGVSRSYLTQLIQKEVGMSPQEYLTSVRMGYAKQHLAKTDDLIRDVAAGCGYEDALAFSKAFKRKFGISPSEYRSQSRNGENTRI